MYETSDEELVQVIADFLELGHVENIVAMFKQDTSLYGLTGKILQDERYMVRMGMAVLFEELTDLRPQEVALAIPSLLPLLKEEDPYVRGEAATLLGIIGTDEVKIHLRILADDPDPQVAEIVRDILSTGR